MTEETDMFRESSNPLHEFLDAMKETAWWQKKKKIIVLSYEIQSPSSAVKIQFKVIANDVQISKSFATWYDDLGTEGQIAWWKRIFKYDTEDGDAVIGKDFLVLEEKRLFVELKYSGSPDYRALLYLL